MSSFLYFVESTEPITTLDKVRELGLAHAFDKVPTSAIMPGPSGKSGTLLFDTDQLDPWVPKYSRDEQTWRRFPQPHATTWVGIYKKGKPTPGDLARETLVPGYELELADKRNWQVPLARIAQSDGKSDTCLPQYLDVDETGKPIGGEVLEQYAHLVPIAERFYSAWYNAYLAAIADGKDRFLIPCPTIVPDACEMLGANYRLGIAEVMLLKLFRTDGTAAEVMRHACDTYRAQTAIELSCDQKKNGLRILRGGDLRWLAYRRWASGLMPGYAPTFADLLALHLGL